MHNSVYEADNIHTEYEDNFSAKGFTINRLVGTVDKSLAPKIKAEPESLKDSDTEKTDEKSEA